VIEVPFEVTIDKNIKNNMFEGNEVKNPGLLHGRTFKGNFVYDSSKVDQSPGGQTISLLKGQGGKQGLMSIVFDFVDLETGTKPKRYSEKDAELKFFHPFILFNFGKLDSLFFMVGNVNLKLLSSNETPILSAMNTAGFGISSNPYIYENDSYFLFYLKRGTISGKGKVKYKI
jgi:hypothetical protein